MSSPPQIFFPIENTSLWTNLFQITCKSHIDYLRTPSTACELLVENSQNSIGKSRCWEVEGVTTELTGVKHQMT